MTYAFKSPTKPGIARGTLIVAGCPGTVARVRISVSRGRGQARLKVTDPAAVARRAGGLRPKASANSSSTATPDPPSF